MKSMTKEEFHNWALEHSLSYDLCENEESYTLVRDLSPEVFLFVNIDIIKGSDKHKFTFKYIKEDRIVKLLQANYDLEHIVFVIEYYLDKFNLN